MPGKFKKDAIYSSIHCRGGLLLSRLVFNFQSGIKLFDFNTYWITYDIVAVIFTVVGLAGIAAVSLNVLKHACQRAYASEKQNSE